MKHPSHNDQLKNLNRIEGQIRGIGKMIEEGKYCIEILNQIVAAKSSIASVEGKIIRKHLHHCIRESTNISRDFDEKIEELLRVLKR